MSNMLSLSFRKYKDIVKIYYAIVVQCVVKNVVNIVLEYNWGIIKTKWGYQHLVEPKVGNKCYKSLMAFGNMDSIKCSNNIKLSIEFGAVQGIKCLMDEWEWVLVFNSNVIKSSVVIADPHTSSWLNNK